MWKNSGVGRHYWEVTIHKVWVMLYILRACCVLFKRGIVHDISKYGKEEAPYFASLDQKKRKTVEYGSPEYKAELAKIKPAIHHHVYSNTHHPEYYGGDFSIIPSFDIIEMLADWKAAGRRTKNGNIYASVEYNQKRWGYSDQEKAKLLCTVIEMFGE